MIAQEDIPGNIREEVRDILSDDLGYLEILSHSGDNLEYKADIFDVLHGFDPKAKESVTLLTSRLYDLRREVADRQYNSKEQLYLDRWLMLSETEVKSFNFAIRYMEDWFYKGNWAHNAADGLARPGEYQFNFVPATIFNTLSKIHEIAAYDSNMVQGFVREKIYKLVDEVTTFARSDLDLAQQSAQGAKIFEDSRITMIDSLNYEYFGRKLGKQPLQHVQVPSDLYFAKTCMIAAERIRKQRLAQGESYSFAPDEVFETAGRKKLGYDTPVYQFGRKKDSNLQMHYVAKIMPFAKVTAEFFAEKT